MTMLSFRSAQDEDTVLHMNLDLVRMVVVKTKSRDLDGEEREVQLDYGDGVLQLAQKDCPAFLAALDRLLGPQPGATP